MASLAHVLALDEPTPLPMLEVPLPSFGPNGANRRFVPRRNARFIVRMRDDGQSYEGIDISFGGLMCTGATPTWPGNVVTLDLILPGDHKPVAVHGRVVELVPYRRTVAMRVRFEGIDHGARKRIALWMARATT